MLYLCLLQVFKHYSSIYIHLINYIYLSITLSICHSIYHCIYHSIYLSTYPCLRLSIYHYFYLSIYYSILYRRRLRSQYRSCFYRSISMTCLIDLCHLAKYSNINPLSTSYFLFIYIPLIFYVFSLLLNTFHSLYLLAAHFFYFSISLSQLLSYSSLSLSLSLSLPISLTHSNSLSHSLCSSHFPSLSLLPSLSRFQRTRAGAIGTFILQNFQVIQLSTSTLKDSKNYSISLFS